MKHNALCQIIVTGIISGMRAFSGPAVTGRIICNSLSSTAHSAALNFLKKEQVKTGSDVLALLEFTGDKLPFTPNRTDPMQLGARVISGAYCGAVLSENAGYDKVTGALIGAGAATASTFSFFFLRRELSKKTKLPNLLLGLTEDALVITIAALLLKSALKNK